MISALIYLVVSGGGREGVGRRIYTVILYSYNYAIILKFPSLFT